MKKVKSIGYIALGIFSLFFDSEVNDSKDNSK